MCKYGEKCFQKNPMHHEKFRHPNSPQKRNIKPKMDFGEPKNKKTKVRKMKLTQREKNETASQEKVKDPEGY